MTREQTLIELEDVKHNLGGIEAKAQRMGENLKALKAEADDIDEALDRASEGIKEALDILRSM